MSRSQSTAFDWSGFLDVAARLRSEPGEACARTAVSRAYYWAYHQSKLALGNSPLANARHFDYWQGLALADKPRWAKSVADLGQTLMAKRLTADYDRKQDALRRNDLELVFALVGRIRSLLPS